MTVLIVVFFQIENFPVNIQMTPDVKDKDKAYYEKCRVKDCRKKKPECPPKPKDTTPCLPQKSSSIIETPHFIKVIGPKQINIALSYVPPLVRYGTAALITLFYVADFKTLLQYLPIYNTKYITEEDVVKKQKEALVPVPVENKEGGTPKDF